MRVPRRELGAYRLYLAMECSTSFLVGITSATIAVYWVTTGRLNPLQLVLLGTSLELSYFLFQLPTGALADAVSRRLCVLVGLFILGLGLVIEGLSAAFANLVAAQVVLGLGYALNNGALEAPRWRLRAGHVRQRWPDSRRAGHRRDRHADLDPDRTAGGGGGAGPGRWLPRGGEPPDPARDRRDDGHPGPRSSLMITL
jgi:MFS family permease